jgi:peptidoglycan/xylan/chitin deacetylase (PgdA/CDA1 family)
VWLRTLFGACSPGGTRARLLILIFHRVLPDHDPMNPTEPTVKQFDRICGWLRSWFNILPLEEAVLMLRTRTLPPRAAAITFDDGYADNCQHALPVLRRHGLTATFFVATGYLDGGRMWNDTITEVARRATPGRLDLRSSALDHLQAFSLSGRRERHDTAQTIIAAAKYLPQNDREELAAALARTVDSALPTDLMMTSDEVRQIHQAGQTIGAHTVSHPILSHLGEERIRLEVENSRDQLQGIVGTEVRLFAYPNGKPGVDFDRRAVEVVRNLGFLAAVSTCRGIAAADANLLALPRFTPWDSSRLGFGLRLASMYRPDSGARALVD